MRESGLISAKKSWFELFPGSSSLKSLSYELTVIWALSFWVTQCSVPFTFLRLSSDPDPLLLFGSYSQRISVIFPLLSLITPVPTIIYALFSLTSFPMVRRKNFLLASSLKSSLSIKRCLLKGSSLIPWYFLKNLKKQQ